jgi:hypothetical protein
MQQRQANGGRGLIMRFTEQVNGAPVRSALGKAIGVLLLLLGVCLSDGATFTNSASIQVSDPSGSLTSASGIFTVSCWFRISVPSSLALSDNMDILMDRTDGNESANFSYLLRYNYANNAVEFVTHGSSGNYSKTLIPNPYLERWYHVAVVRSGSTFTCYVDGRPVLPSDSATLGSTVGGGVAIGGISGNSLGISLRWQFTRPPCSKTSSKSACFRTSERPQT